MPGLTVRALPFYESSIVPSGNATLQGVPLTADNSTCGRVLALASIKTPSVAWNQDPCEVVPLALNASTGDVVRAMANPACLPSFEVSDQPNICLPLPCQLGKIPDSTTCDQFAKSISTSTANVTTTQFLSWNPNMLGLCTNTTAQFVCVGAPGGTYISPPTNNTSSDGSQQRGGGNGGGTPTGSGGPDGSGGRNATFVQPGQAPPGPTQSGIASGCTKFGVAQAGDGCTTFATSYGITLDTLVGWNPVLGVHGANCATALEAGDYYCVGVGAVTGTASATPTSTQPSVSTPSPVQSGITGKCVQFAIANAGEWCDEFATKHSITDAQLYAWNPVLGSNGENCNTLFEAGEYYCIGVSTAATSTIPTTTITTTTGAASTPSPVQSDINPRCTQYAMANSGEWCDEFATKHSITDAQLYAWNPILGTNGAQCTTLFQAGEYYCVGAPATPTHTSVAAPGPTQTGITSNCNKFAESIPNKGCEDFAAAVGITPAQLYAWNTVLGTNGQNCASNMWAGEYYCVGVWS